MYVRDHMSSPPVVVGEQSSLDDARALLEGRRIRHLPVTDGLGRLVGILSDRDLRSIYPSRMETEEERERALKRLERVGVGEVMTRDPWTLPLDGTLDDALYIFERRKVGALPVVDGEGRVAGVFSVQDLMGAYRELFGLGEEGSAFIEIEDDGSRDLVSRTAAVLEELDIPLNRLVRRRRAVFLRVSTYNIHGLREALRVAGIRSLAEGARNPRGRKEEKT